ncbi:hypothetical protein J6590_048729 [Homalodisca vitripennis]|nr:hypothetical protein J6590_048729 [Homalodisca vitripennis]
MLGCGFSSYQGDPPLERKGLLTEKVQLSSRRATSLEETANSAVVRIVGWEKASAEDSLGASASGRGNVNTAQDVGTVDEPVYQLVEQNDREGLLHIVNREPILQQRAYLGLVERDQGERRVEVPSRSEYEPEQRTCFGCNVDNMLLRVEKLRSMKFSLHQASILVRESWRRSKSVANYTEQNTLISSANMRYLVRMTLPMSFMNRLNSKGPRWDPCGTPDRTLNGAERHPSYLTTRVLSVKIDGDKERSGDVTAPVTADLPIACTIVVPYFRRS